MKEIRENVEMAGNVADEAEEAAEAEISEAPAKARASKPRKKKKRRKKHYFLRFLIFVALCVGLYYLLTSPLFDIQKITVEGNEYFTVEQVIERSGIKTGENIFFKVDKKDVKSALIEDPYVKNVNVSRNLPGEVVISIEERKEAATIPYSKNYIIVDAEGLVLRTSDVEPKLPQLIGLTVKNMDTGKALEVEENAVLNQTLRMVLAMQKSEVYFKKIDISRVFVKAYVYDSLICQGMPEDIEASLKDGTLQNLLYELYSKGIERGTISINADTTNMAYSPVYE